MQFRARETKGIKESGAGSGSNVVNVKPLIAFHYNAVFLKSGIITRGTNCLLILRSASSVFTGRRIFGDNQPIESEIWHKHLMMWGRELVQPSVTKTPSPPDAPPSPPPRARSQIQILFHRLTPSHPVTSALFSSEHPSVGPRPRPQDVRLHQTSVFVAVKQQRARI